MLENKFQSNLIKEIKTLFPDCIVVKNDPTYIQGIPDLLILNGGKWASLECKNLRVPNDSRIKITMSSVWTK